MLVPQAALAGQPDVPLDRPVTTVGSNDTARLHLVSRTVSKGHAIFVNSGGVTYVADLASRTGVLVNGKSIRDVDLKTGDRVQIGKFVFRYRSPANLSPPPPASVPPAAAVIVVGSPAKAIEGRVFQIGRRETSDICFPTDAAVSAGHAVIFEMDGKWYLRDLGSRTGTTVNGKAIHQHGLNFGDRINIGSSTILFQPGAEAEKELENEPEQIESDLAPDFDEAEVIQEQAPVPLALEPEIEPALQPDDEAIPLADESPLAGAKDWKSAFPASADEPADEPQGVPEAVEPEPLEQTPAAEPLGSVLSEESTPQSETEVPLAPESSTIDPEPLELPAQATEPSGSAAGEPFVADESIELEPVNESPAVLSEESTPQSETEVPPAPESLTIDPEPLELPAQATEPSGSAAGEPLVADESIELEPVNETPDALSEESTPQSETEIPLAPESIATESEPLATELKTLEQPQSLPAKLAAESSAPSPAPPPSLPVVDLSTPVEDFVFVPGDQQTDADAVPQVIFWGDTDLDFGFEPAAAPAPQEVANAEQEPIEPPAAEPLGSVLSEELTPQSETEVPIPPESSTIDPEPLELPAQATEPSGSAAGEPLVTDDAIELEPLTEPPAAEPLGSVLSEELTPQSETEVPLPPDSLTIDPEPLELPAQATEPSGSAAGEPLVTDDAIELEPLTEPPAAEPLGSVLSEELTPQSETEVPLPPESLTIDPEPLELPAQATEPSGSAAGEPLVADEPIELETTTPEPHLPELQDESGDGGLSLADEPILAEPTAAAAEQPADLTTVDDSPADAPAEAVEYDIAPQAIDHSFESIAEIADLEPTLAPPAAQLPAFDEPVIDEPAIEELGEFDLVDDAPAEPAPPISSVVTDEPPAQASIEQIDESPALASTPPTADFTEPGEVEQEISLFDEEPTPAEATTDPLSDSFPLVEAEQDVALPAELQTFSPATSAEAAEADAAPEPQTAIDVEPDSAISHSDTNADTGSDSPQTSIEPPVVSVAQAEPVEPASNLESAPAESITHTDFDLADLEMLEPATTVSAPPTDLSGISTVDELPLGDDFIFDDLEHVGEEPIGFEPIVESVEPEPALPEAESSHEAAHSSDTDEPAVEPAQLDDTATTDEPQTAETEAGEPPAAEPPAAEPPTGGPSIFGFQFEGGSFLGGMPISLKGNAASQAPEAPSAAPPAPPTAPPLSPVFDARATPPAGIGSMISDGAALPPVQPPHAAPSATPRSTPPGTPRPSTPPRPARSAPAAPSAPSSLSGLVGEAHLPWQGAPVIPPVVKGGNGSRGKGLTSNFTAAAQAPRVAEVFSQMSAPIGVEVFGGKPGDPNQFTVPDTRPTEAAVIPLQPQTDAAAEQGAAGTDTSPKLAPLPAKARRASRLPLYLLLCVAIPALIAGLVYKFVPVSVQVQGALPFEGLTGQQTEDVHLFHQQQEQLLSGNDVRLKAQKILQDQGLALGPTADDGYQAMVASQNLNWDSSGNFQLLANSTDEPLAKAQVTAVLGALAQKDRELDDARNDARAAAAAAKQALEDSSTRLQTIIRERRDLSDKAMDRPDVMIVSRAHDDRDRLVQQWTDAKTLRENSEKALAQLRSENPAIAPDPNADRDVKALQAQLQPILDQIARLRGTGSVDAGAKVTAGSDVPLGATTQPDTDPLIIPLQQQADLISQKLATRRSDLAAVAAIGPEQRAVDQARAIEDLSVKITSLQNLENQAKSAADQASAAAAAYDAKVAAARVASEQAEVMVTTQTNAEADQQRAREDSEQKEAALAKCVTVKGSPVVTTLSTTDLRPKLAGAFSVGSWIVLGLLIIGELRRPKLMTSVTPAAAPRVNPPVRLMPRPQPKEINALSPTAAEKTSDDEAEQAIGAI